MSHNLVNGITLGKYLSKFHNVSIEDELPTFKEYMSRVLILPLKKFETHLLSSKLKFRDQSYKKFLRLLAINLIKEQSQNILISGLPRIKVNTYFNNAKYNFTKSSFFMISELESDHWERIYQILGSGKFSDLLINCKGFLRKDKGYVQFFGDSISYTPREGAVEHNSIQKRSLLQKLNKRQSYWNFKLLNVSEVELCKEIFGSSIKGKRYNKIIYILKHIIRNDDKCRYNLMYRSMLCETDINFKDVSKNANSLQDIFSFIFSILGKILTIEAWGGEKNKKIIRKRIVDYIKLDSNGCLNIHEIMKDLQLKDFTWLGTTSNITSKQDFEIRKNLLKQYITWLFDSLLKKIVKAFWYITESTSGEILFFPRHVWHKISTLWLENYAKDNFIKTTLVGNEKYNYGKLKLVPKKNSFRLICVPVKRSTRLLTEKLSEYEQERQRIEFNVFKANTLRPIRLILIQKLNSKIETDVRFSVTATSNRVVANRMVDFRSRLLSLYDGKIPKLYMIKFDMKECYDRMNQKKLIEKVIGLFKDDPYQHKYYFKSFYKSDALLRIEKTKYKVETEFHKLNILSEDFDKLNKGIWSDKGKTLFFTRAQIIDECIQQIFGAKGFIEGTKSPDFKFYRRKQGIFQGFILSSIFCDILYSSMVADTFKFLWESELKEPFFFTRMVDDFLFLSTNKELYDKVSEIVNGQQLEKYGAFVNHEKTQQINHKEEANLDQTFQFVGLEIELSTLNFNKNYKDLGVLPTTRYRTFKTLLTFLRSSYCVRLHEYILKKDSDFIDSILSNINNLLEFTISSFKEAFKGINKIDQFNIANFCKFLVEIINETIKKYMIVNRTVENLDDLYDGLKECLIECLHEAQYVDVLKYLDSLELE
ncbi:EST2 [Candida jiufengensis]|uniref:EST2 n=1 Tax=Candida jiufengensis TaxID=497108 RepID=UPI002225656B|nr:EST2 [Candida jiufengensis]KAI5951479.1 EST2 [Candida jiufengensis]